MKRYLKITIIGLCALFVVVGCSTILILSNDEFGGKMDEKSLEKAKASSQYAADHFENTPEVLPYGWKTNIKDMFGGQLRIPPGPFPADEPIISKTVGDGLKATWFGHATVYIEMDGKRIMIDPMLSTHAFPLKAVAPERFNPPPLLVEELPAIDIVAITHDHFDHLDMHSIQGLAEKGTQFFVGLGIKAHLVKWGVKEDQITEMDWWESETMDDFVIHCTPARHYSGRTGMNNSTLWTSWVIESPEHSIFHSGDSGYESHFKEIGEKFGRIDIGFIKIGDYGLDLGWQDIHMHTEKSVQAAKDVNASLMFPIHWGTFNLSNHDWFEPINLAVEFTKKENVSLVTPMLGQTISFGDSIQNEYWWKFLEKKSLEAKK